MGKSLLAASAVLVVLGCGGGSSGSADKGTVICGRVFDAICAKWVECRTTLGQGGAVITAAFCQQNRATGVSNCVADGTVDLNMVSDAQVDTCVQALNGFACSNLCNQVPQGPAECASIGGAQSTDIVYCAQ